ncbi:LPXTG cell wall anchor domain-containing protein [Streptococcus sp. X16XC17]|uniref:LPXTG cell wall anchor domain-containing protein n=1 Tax=unclassified Streptococcus TaxID=2608887 RepID=UPI00066FC490|nr:MULTISPECIES: LPXTG cell wall anchor domain-containing protein [unclassified Streptococcus]TCD46376.1 LPXTG cell wall anchor domain-containing protein [Streptococcus sp. X16XC17]
MKPKVVNNTLVVTDHKEPVIPEPKDEPKEQPEDSPKDTVPTQPTSTQKKVLPKTNSTETMNLLIAGIVSLVVAMVIFLERVK